MGYPSKGKKRPPSIKDVAELAGVSWSTVSNVIRNQPHVRPETQARVEEAIRALGYRTNTAGRQLRQGRSGTVVVGAILLPRALSGTDIARTNQGVPLVLLAETSGGSGVDTVAADGRAIAFDAVGHLVETGHNNIA